MTRPRIPKKQKGRVLRCRYGERQIGRDAPPRRPPRAAPAFQTRTARRAVPTGVYFTVVIWRLIASACLALRSSCPHRIAAGSITFRPLGLLTPRISSRCAVRPEAPTSFAIHLLPSNSSPPFTTTTPSSAGMFHSGSLCPITFTPSSHVRAPKISRKSWRLGNVSPRAKPGSSGREASSITASVAMKAGKRKLTTFG